MRLFSLAYGLALANKGTKWWEMPRSTEFETATLDGIPTSKVVGGTYHGTPSETSYVYVFCAYEFIWSVIYCAVSEQAVAAMGYYILSRRLLPCSCSSNYRQRVTLYLGTTVQPLMITHIATMHSVQPSRELVSV